MPDFIRAMIEEFGRRVADGCRVQWRQNEATDVQARIDRRYKISKDWGEAFSELRLLIEGCVQHGDVFNRAQLETRLKRNKLRNEVLARLHIRVCRLAEEIVMLLENGFAEGGRARWRTLLEVSITMILIAEGGNDLAARYLDHDAIDRKKALDDLDRSARDAGTRGVDRGIRNEIEVQAARVVRRYGSAFRGMYGWAAGQLGLPDKPQFHDLQELAGLIASKLQYRIACFGNHASAQSLNQLLHEWDPTLHIPDMFAPGFDDPAVNTAYSLVHATSTLFGEPWDLDKLIELRTLTCFRDDVETAFRSTTRRIDRAERRSMDRAARRPGKPSVWQRRSRFSHRRSLGHSSGHA